MRKIPVTSPWCSSPRDRARRALVERARVGVWNWRDETCRSMVDLRALRADENLRKTVLRLTLDMTLTLDEYDEAERILTELKGSLSANPTVGVLIEEREGLRLAMGGLEDFEQDLPPVLQSVVKRLQTKAKIEPELAERALHHLYQLVKGVTQ